LSYFRQKRREVKGGERLKSAKEHHPWLVVVVDGHRCIADAQTGKLIGYDADFDRSRVQIEIPTFNTCGIMLGVGQVYRKDKKDFVRYVLMW
jgi:hypothetical protein